MSRGNGRDVNRADLAAIFGVSLPTIDSWVKNGCPGVKSGIGKGGTWSFDTAAVARWREQRAAEEASGDTVADEAALKKRKLLAETIAAEHDMMIKKRLVAPLDQVERAMSRVFAEVRTNMRSLPSRCVTQLIGENDERQFKRVLLAEIDVVLESLAEFDVMADERSGSADDDV
ncbi:putative small terminase [Xanthomonas phage FoX3]|uniref:Putative small terminase n=1 Tax=Xanthomonas phage FoX3 TaxID=2723899 RepID=A0A858NPG5_9CAUD|nr:terminase small subunit [Xanthomonas phage FoX3]QJB21901.1 putative small terminase [Xanthomonas phage FoX3]